MFRICPHCDFEWHDADGDSCPACNPDAEDESDSARSSEKYDGGRLEVVRILSAQESLSGPWVDRIGLPPLLSFRREMILAS